MYNKVKRVVVLIGILSSLLIVAYLLGLVSLATMYHIYGYKP